MAYNMSANGGLNRKRRDQEQNYHSDDFSQNIFENSNKKVRMDQESANPPSCVVHIRNVPADLDDTMISYLAIPFGYIDNVVCVRKNNQALIQMREINDAVEMVDYFSQFVPQIYGKHLFVQFSKHQKLDLRSGNTNIDKLIEHANEKREYYLSNWANNNLGASEILRILIDNASNLTINHLVFYKIFSRFGHIARIVSFTKNNQHHGLVEFANPLPAHVAQLQLNGVNLLGDGGTMRVDFSKNAGPLQVQRQSDKVRDYLEHPITEGEQQEIESPQYSFPLFSMGRSVGMSMNRPNEHQYLSTISKYMSDPMSTLPSYYDGAPSSFSSMTNRSGVDLMTAASFMAVYNPRGSRNSDSRSWGFGSHSQNEAYSSNNSGDSQNSVVLITNLNPEKSNPDDLFTLFGVFGDVLRVKVMFNKKNTALVQLANHQHAMTAIRNLDGAFLWGKQMHLHISKTNVIQLPMEDSNHGMTKDYSNSTLHRFKKPNSKNYQNIYPPSHILHLSNIPPTTVEGDLTSMFQNSGYVVKRFKYLPNDKKMALVELGSVEEAVHALIEFHNFKLSEKNNLRIKFSKAGSF